MAHTQEAAEAILEPHMETLGGIFPAAWEKWEGFGKELPGVRMLCGKRTRASLMSDLSVSQASSVFAGKSSSVILHEGRKFLLIEFDSQLCVRLNKFRAGGRQMSGINTLQREAFGAQEPLTGMPETTNLVLGYELNRDETDIAAVAVTCSTNGRLNWEIEVPLPGEAIALDTHSQRTDVRGPRITSTQRDDQKNVEESGA